MLNRIKVGNQNLTLKKFKKIAVINCGAGNIGSVINALKFLEYEPVLLDNPENKTNYSHLILPGVGAFGKIAENLKNNGFYNYISNHINGGNYLLGICVGMQMLFKESEESDFVKGLCLIDAKIKRFSFSKSNKLPIPHVGFASVDSPKSLIFNGISAKIFLFYTFI